MVTKIIKIGEAHGIQLDDTVMDLAELKEGDEMKIEVNAGGTITLVPTQLAVEANQATARAKHLIHQNSELFRRLS